MATIVCRLIAVLTCTDPVALRLKPVHSTVLAVGGSIITPAHGLAEGVDQISSVPGSGVSVLASPHSVQGGLPNGGKGR